MNFSPFGNAFSASISGIHQFAAGAQVSHSHVYTFPKINLLLAYYRNRIDITITVRQMQPIWTIVTSQTFRYCRNFVATTAYKSIMDTGIVVRLLVAPIIRQICRHIHPRPTYIRAAMTSNAYRIPIHSQTHPIYNCINRSLKSLKTFATHF